MKYRKKPVVVEAYQYTGQNRSEWPLWLRQNQFFGKFSTYVECGEDNKYAKIETLEGTMKANYGDYIVQGVQGEIYPCKPDIFVQTYEEIKE